MEWVEKAERGEVHLLSNRPVLTYPFLFFPPAPLYDELRANPKVVTVSPPTQWKTVTHSCGEREEYLLPADDSRAHFHAQKQGDNRLDQCID
jgi:hypothetical protein